MIRFVLALIALAVPAAADPVSLKALSDYVNALDSARTEFVQYNADGTRSKGTLHIRRPGRMKFEYDPPNDALVLASAGVVAIFDAKSNAEPQTFPLRRTPLNLILGRDVDLSDTAMVFRHFKDDNGMTVIAARDPKNPDSGMIELYFTSDPIALSQWVITDEAGRKTGVALGPLDRNVSYPSVFFSVNAETNRRLR